MLKARTQQLLKTNRKD